VEDLKVRLRKAEHELNALGNTAQPWELGGGHGAHSDADGYGGEEEGADDGNTLAAKRRQLFAQLKAKVWGYLDARSVLEFLRGSSRLRNATFECNTSRFFLFCVHEVYTIKFFCFVYHYHHRAG
jgi:hypothetical protein